MTDSQCREAFKPCRKCGSTDFDLWDGRGTQAEMDCDCGNHESIQVSDYLTQEERFGNDPDFQWHDDKISYGEKAVSRAREQLAREWNARAEPVPDEAMVERVFQAVKHCATDEGEDGLRNVFPHDVYDGVYDKPIIAITKAAIAAMRGDTLRAAAVQALDAMMGLKDAYLCGAGYDLEPKIEDMDLNLKRVIAWKSYEEAIIALETALKE